MGVLGADGLGVEDDEVGVEALGDAAPVAQPEQPGGHVGHELHGPLERHQLAAAQGVAEEPGGVRRAAHAVEVRAGVGAAEHGALVGPGLPAQLPRGGVAVGRHGPQDRAQVVGAHDVDQRGERVLAALGGDVADAADPAGPRSPRRRCRR